MVLNKGETIDSHCQLILIYKFFILIGFLFEF